MKCCKKKAKYWRALSLLLLLLFLLHLLVHTSPFFSPCGARGVAGVEDNPVTGPAQTLALSHINISCRSSLFFSFSLRDNREREKWEGKRGTFSFHSSSSSSSVPLSRFVRQPVGGIHTRHVQCVCRVVSWHVLNDARENLEAVYLVDCGFGDILSHIIIAYNKLNSSESALRIGDWRWR